MKIQLMKKRVTSALLVLFMIIAVTPSIGFSNYLDDTTPPFTTISFNPPEPDGENGWYVSTVTVTLNATDDDSGVNVTKYRIDGGIWYNYTEPFILADDGEDVLIEFYSVDNAENVEEVKSAVIDIDKTSPEIILSYEVIGGTPETGYQIIFTATANDETSGMNKVEFYLNDILQETVNGPGPIYQWEYHLPPNYPLYGLKVRGLILNPEITDEYIKFYAIIVIIFELYHYHDFSVYAYDNAGNIGEDCIPQLGSIVTVSTGIYLFENVSLPNSYEGYIGKFFIKATFDV